LAIGFAPVGSVLVGLGTALTGMAFAGITAVTVQLSEYSRSAAGMAGVALGVSFVLRALGDMAGVGGTALSWASPLGWPAQTAPFVHDRWAPLIPLVLLAVAGVVSGYALQDRRDFGASLIAPRPGPAHAGRSLSSPLGLAARLQRGAFLGWGIGILALGAVDALLSRGVGDARGRPGTALSTSVGRAVWLGSHALVVACGVVVIGVAVGLGAALAAAAVTGDGGVFTDVLLAHVALLPEPLLILAVCVALFGVAPRLTALVGWALVALTAIVTMFADLLDLPGWLRAVSPLYHLA